MASSANASSAASGSKTIIDPSRLTLTFSEEFHTLKLQQQGAADGWNAAYSWDRYDSHSAHTIFGEAEVYVDPTFKGLGLNPFTIKDGVLSISATKTPAWAKEAVWNHDYMSGVLTTEGSFEQKYGYFEMRADLPEGKGSFPAFWLLDDTYNEIDVVEIVNGVDEVWNHVHSHAEDGSSQRKAAGFSTKIPDLTDGFHTFGVLWTPEKIAWYVDGVELASTASPAIMNKPMYMLANYAVGGSWAGSPDGSPLGDMKIDYIRAYSLDPAAGPSPAPATPPPASGTADVFTLAVGSKASLNFDPAQDKLAIPTGAGGFQLRGAAETMVDASAWWTNISKATVIRWLGEAAKADSTAEIDGLLQSMPGNQGRGVLVAAYTPEGKVGVYYDAAPGSAGGTSLVAELKNLTNVNQLTSDDFQTAGSGTGGSVTPAPAKPTPADPSSGSGPGSGSGNGIHKGGAGTDYFTGGAGADHFMLDDKGADVIFRFDAAQDDMMVRVGAGGFDISASAGVAPVTKDVANAWTSMDGAQLVRWVGAANDVNTAGEVDGLLNALPGNKAGGAFVLAYTEGLKVGLYFDEDPANLGGVTLVGALDNVTNVRDITGADLIFI